MRDRLQTVIVDGPERDRCPYAGDEAVIGRTLDVSTPRWAVQRAMLGWFGAHQHADGQIPASPLHGGTVVLADYSAYWIVALHDYVLSSGDVALARRLWPRVERLLDVYYPAHTHGGLFANDAGSSDYAVPPRRQIRRLLQRPVRLRTRARGGGGAVDRTRSTPRRGRRAASNSPYRSAKRFGTLPPAPSGTPPAIRQRIPKMPRHSRSSPVWRHANGILVSLLPQRACVAGLWQHRQRHRHLEQRLLVGTRNRVYPFISYFEVLARLHAHRGQPGTRAYPTRMGLHGEKRAAIDDVGDDRAASAAARRTISACRGMPAGRAGPHPRSLPTCSASSQPRPGMQPSPSPLTRATFHGPAARS